MRMSFRRQRDEWDEFLKQHADAIQRSGVPSYVMADKMRFLVFLDHGFDELGWGKNPYSFFDSSTLSDEQIAELAKLVGDHIDEGCRKLIESRWTRRS